MNIQPASLTSLPFVKMKWSVAPRLCGLKIMSFRGNSRGAVFCFLVSHFQLFPGLSA
jgi:hypothetical protein